MDVIGSIVRLTEILTRNKMSEEDQQDGNLIIARFK